MITLLFLLYSWYSSKTIFDVTYTKKKYNYIGAIKTNRVLYPEVYNKLGIKVHSFGKSLPRASFDLVIVRNKEYYVYKYVGDLNDRKNVAIVLSYPKDSLYENSTLKAFISLDSTLPILRF